MHTNVKTELEAPRVEQGKELLIAGMSMTFRGDASSGIPALWQKFAPYIGHVPGQRGNLTYGVVTEGNDGDSMTYMCGVEVDNAAAVQPPLTTLRLAPQRYLVFQHRGHISEIRATRMAIMDEGVPRSGYQPADAPWLELYSDSFDPRTGNGGLELWVPVK